MKDLIDRYFENTLSDEEKRVFFTLLDKDDLLKEEFNFQQNLKNAVHAKEREELKYFLKKLEATRKQKKWSWIAGTAAVFLLVLGLVFIPFKNTEYRLAEKYFHPLPNIINPIQRGDGGRDNTNLAFEKYEAENYNGAVVEFEKFKEQPFAKLYLGISYLALKNPSKAIEILESFSHTDLPLETYRKWYLALAYLETGEKRISKELFLDLSKFKNPVQEQSKQILMELE